MRALAGLGLLLVAAASATAATPIRATLTTTTPTPRVDQPWRWTVTVRDSSGAPLRARLKLQILLGGTVVGCWQGGAMRQCSGASPGDWIAFRGKRSGVLRWPAESAGVRLTFQALVKAAGQTRRLRAPVTVSAGG